MKIIIAITCLFLTTKAHCQLNNGVYEGLERMTGYDPPRKWFHQNTVYVRNDTLFLYKEPIVIHKKDTIHSASDGGFYYYFGTLHQLDTILSVRLARTNCDYCLRSFRIDTATGFRYPIVDTTEYKIRKTATGFSMNGVQYTLKNKNLDLFPEEMFYPSPNDMYRIDPAGQYKLISQSIATFLDSLRVTGDTLYICSDRYEINFGTGKDFVLESLDTSRLNIHYRDKKIAYISYVSLKKRMAHEPSPFRFLQIGEIIDYKQAARITLTYKILIPVSVKGFSERQYRTLLEYNKSGDDYILAEGPSIGFELIEK